MLQEIHRPLKGQYQFLVTVSESSTDFNFPSSARTIIQFHKPRNASPSPAFSPHTSSHCPCFLLFPIFLVNHLLLHVKGDTYKSALSQNNAHCCVFNLPLPLLPIIITPSTFHIYLPPASFKGFFNKEVPTNKQTNALSFKVATVPPHGTM